MKNMAKKLFIAAMCLSMSVTAVPAVTGTTQTVSAEQTAAKNGLYHEGSDWNYYENGSVSTDTTTLVKYNGSWWYVHGGKIDFSANTLVKFNGSWWYVHGGKVDFGARTLVKYNGTWWFVEGGRVNWNSETVVKYNGTWFYVKNGQVNWNSGETLCKYNHFWWYIKNGKINFNSTTLCKYNGTWWYVRGGRVDFGNDGERICTGEMTEDGFDYGKYMQHSDILGDADSYYTLCYYNGSWWAVSAGQAGFMSPTAIRYGEYFYLIICDKVDFSGQYDFSGYDFKDDPSHPFHYEFHNGVCPVKAEMGNITVIQVY